jgi:hypothetical protein
MCTVPSSVKFWYLRFLVLTILIQNFTVVHLVMIEPSVAEVNVSCALYKVL